MKNINFIYIVLFCFLLAQPFYGEKNHQNFYFRSLEVEDGLSQNMVYSILQDKQGFMWFGTQDGLNRYDGNNFKIYQRNHDIPNSIENNGIFSLAQDEDDIIWVGTIDGVYLYNPKFDKFEHFSAKTDDGVPVHGIVRDIEISVDGSVWMAVSDKGVFCFPPNGKLLFFPLNSYGKIDIRRLEFDIDANLWIATHHQGLFKLEAGSGKIDRLLADNKNGNTPNDVNDIYLYNTETLLLATANKGVQKLNLRNYTLEPLLEKGADGKPLFVRCIYKDRNDLFWFGTETGIYTYNTQTKQEILLQHHPNDPYSISDNAIHSIYEDREGGIWLGTFFGGVNYFSDLYARFEKYYPIKGENTISGKSISEFCEDDDGNIWIGTEDAGLNCFNTATRSFSHGFIPSTNVHALMYDNKQLWVGTFSDGLYRIDLSNNKTKRYVHSSDSNSLNDNNVYSIYKDYSGTIWIGSLLGLHKYDKNHDYFIRVNEHKINKQVNDILEDFRGVIWFATLGSGLFSYDKKNDKWNHYPNLTTGKTMGNMITCLLEDSKHNLWVGTEGAGLFMYKQESDSFEDMYSINNGLPNDVIYRLVEDIQDNLWGSTNKGLFKIDVNNNISTYTHSNGLFGDQFNYKSGFRSKSGKIFFGGVKGFVAFSPDKLFENEILPSVVINSIQILNKEVVPDIKGSPLRHSITYTDLIELPYNTPVFGLEFAALSYVFPQGNRYAYKLDSRDKDWIYTDRAHRVAYSDLPPGNYIFRVKASNSDGRWTDDEASIRINILPPFYMTIWAYIFYIISIFAILYVIIRNSTKRIERKNRQALQDLESRKEKELYNAKIHFFTNVTHEIRTPLSLIKAPLDEVMKQVDESNANWENLSIIRRNANRLLKLVNELLDFRKVETKGLSLNFVTIDIIELIKETVSRFLPSAQIKGLTIRTVLPDNGFKVDVDGEIITKILSNLLNNALKYSQSIIDVFFTVDKDRFRIIVENDGTPIPEKYAQKIFDPFFKIDDNISGSGLGLPFAKSLTELHNGKIILDEKNKEKTSFIVELPIRQKMVIQLNEEFIPETSEPKKENKNLKAFVKTRNRKTILLVEDNKDFQKFVSGQLDADYNVLHAYEGRHALEILNVKNVDIVISDVMMPVMDGMELCKTIKENLNFSHIPVILLTAKTALQAKIEGLKIGADEYIEKPYSIDYLKVRIENLLENRKIIKESYKHSPELAYNTIVNSKADEDFLNKLVSVIHSQIEEVDLDVDKLAFAMNMSRASFYRKVKSISELTPNDFIRLVRLKKAAELLKEKEYKVNEIAFIVGFKSSSYFAKCFYKQFGVLPKDF